MKTHEQLKKLQFKLEQEEFICPICKEIEQWWTYNRHGCDKAFGEYLKDSRRQDQIEEQDYDISK